MLKKQFLIKNLWTLAKFLHLFKTIVAFRVFGWRRIRRCQNSHPLVENTCSPDALLAGIQSKHFVTLAKPGKSIAFSCQHLNRSIPPTLLLLCPAIYYSSPKRAFNHICTISIAEGWGTLASQSSSNWKITHELAFFVCGLFPSWNFRWLV